MEKIKNVIKDETTRIYIDLTLGAFMIDASKKELSHILTGIIKIKDFISHILHRKQKTTKLIYHDFGIVEETGVYKIANGGVEFESSEPDGYYITDPDDKEFWEWCKKHYSDETRRRIIKKEKEDRAREENKLKKNVFF